MSDNHKSVTITLAQLQARFACRDQSEQFRRRFGESVTFTSCDEFVDACVANPDFDYNWTARNLLSPENQVEYERLSAPIWAEYDRQHAPIWAEYERQQATIKAEYDRQHAPIWAEYERQCAAIWARLYWAQSAN